MNKLFLYLLFILFFYAPLVHADIVSIDYGGTDQICINQGDDCLFVSTNLSGTEDQPSASIPPKKNGGFLPEYSLWFYILILLVLMVILLIVLLINRNKIYHYVIRNKMSTRV